MHYVIGDIHNELNKLKSILGQINLTSADELIVLGDMIRYFIRCLRRVNTRLNRMKNKVV